MVAETLIYTSYTIGFISFFLTLLTWLGVYISLITSMRSAPRTLPIILGNLRQGLLAEKSLMKYRIKSGDQYHVFPGRQMHKVGNQQSHIKLTQETIKAMWKEFRNIEKRFVVQENGDVEAGKSEDDASGSSEKGWVDEKQGGAQAKRMRRTPRRDSHIRSRMGVAEAGLSVDRRTYYNTDLWHRVLWWWKTSEVQSLSDRIEKLQIRRMEADMWETDELVKRSLRILGGMSGDDIWYPDDRGPHGGRRRPGGGKGGGGGGGVGSLAGSDRSDGVAYRRKATSRAGSRNVKLSRKPSSVGGGVREVYEKEFVRVKNQSSSDDSRPAGDEPSNSNKPTSSGRRQQRDSRARAPSVMEYEIIRPGRVWVETEGGRSNTGRLPVYDDRSYEERPRSYSRERSPSRGRR